LDDYPLGRDGKFDFVPVKMIPLGYPDGDFDALRLGDPGLYLKGLLGFKGLSR
jgi:hypothetical protein